LFRYGPRLQGLQEGASVNCFHWQRGCSQSLFGLPGFLIMKRLAAAATALTVILDGAAPMFYHTMFTASGKGHQVAAVDPEFSSARKSGFT
jgi:hypothetical protein